MDENNTENNNPVPGSFRDGQLHGTGKGCGIGDQVIRRASNKNRVGPAFQSVESCQGKCRSGVATGRFQQQAIHFNACFPQLLKREKPMRLIRHHERAGSNNTICFKTGYPLGCQLKQTVFPGQAKKLFWKTRSRQWPEAGSVTTAQNNGLNCERCQRCGAPRLEIQSASVGSRSGTCF